MGGAQGRGDCRVSRGYPGYASIIDHPFGHLDEPRRCCNASGNAQGRTLWSEPMFRFGMKNLRRLKDVPLVEIRPITLLVGRNSSGKSTFLRSFPLLRQSITRRIRYPILWYGESVDYGDFKGSVYLNDDNLPICFKFGVDQVSIDRNMFLLQSFAPSGQDRSPIIVKDIELEIYITMEGDITSISNIKLKIGEHADEVVIQTDQSQALTSMSVNGRDALPYFADYYVGIRGGTAVPDVLMHQRRKESNCSPWSSR